MTLSDKISEAYGYNDDHHVIPIEYVKEFIKELKEVFRYSSLWKGDSISEEIDKLAGEKLI